MFHNLIETKKLIIELEFFNGFELFVELEFSEVVISAPKVIWFC